MEWGPLKDRIIEATAAAVLLGGGAQVISTTVDVAKHDERLERVEKIDDRIEIIQQEVSETREAVARLETKLEK